MRARAGRRHVAIVMTGLMLTAASASTPTPAAESPAPGAHVAQVAPGVTLRPVRFAALPGWARDDHAAAFAALLRSCDRVLAQTAQPTAGVGAQGDLRRVCQQAAARRAAADGGRLRSHQARAFFEHYFRPHRVVHDGPPGLLTGYYEPWIEGSLVRTPHFRVPIYRRPPDLENVVAETQRGAPDITYTHMRRTADGLVPFYTRTEIENGALAGRGLELIWLADPVDAFFLQIQGSGKIRFGDGRSVRVTYDGKNGYPYTSIGRYLIDQGVIGAEAMSLESLGAYLRTDEARGRAVMQRNASFAFFRELAPHEGERALGAMDIGLTPGRSLAVDTSVHALGLPIYVVAPTLRHATARPRPFRRLMVAQDVGSAIRGPERGDIFFGSGDRAGALAGVTKEAGHFFVLLPRSRSAQSFTAVRPAE